MRGGCSRVLAWCVAVVFGGGALGSEFSAADLDFYERKVRPVLADHCYKCHSAGAEKIKGGLLLDSHDAILKGGDSGAIVSPGDAEKSRLIVAVRQTDKDLVMPPKEKLSDPQIADLVEWVKRGLPAPEKSKVYIPEKDLWVVKPLTPGSLPTVTRKDWPRDPLDFYLLAKLEENHLTPAPPAQKLTLLRRVTFDLTGLPPTPQAVREFLTDQSSNAYEKVVDRLLASPQFGERWGRHWLDIARYADSSGLENNALFNNAWRYRDYVVKAFNTDKPYNRFVTEQLAGDLLPASSIDEQHELWIATGFLVLGPKPFEPNREKLIMDVVDEQIDVTCRGLLGLTASCARCHDHKFDPIPTRDYYSLAGIFKSTVTLNEGAGPNPFGRIWSERPLGTAEQSAEFEKYTKQLTTVEAKVNAARQLRQTLPGGIDSKKLDGIVIDNLDAEVIGGWKLSNYSTNFVDKNYLHDGDDRREKGKKLVRFHPNIPQPGFYEIRLAYTARPNRATNVPVRVQAIGGTRTVYLNQRVEPKYDKAFETLGVFDLPAGTNSVVEVATEGTKGFVVVDAIQFLPKDVQLAAQLRRKPEMPEVISDEVMMVKPSDLEDLEYNLLELRAKSPPDLPSAMAVLEGRPQNSRIYMRGDIEKPGEEAPRGFLNVIAKARPATFTLKKKDSSGRLDLAQWITDPQNPVTPRVMVNRVWLHLFGRGLVNTPDNFGSLGDQPSHPELLDYLAQEFIREGWSTKKLIRRIITSSAYQMSSQENPNAYAIDPDNRLLWRMNRKRLEVEAIRDSMLLVNGELDPKLGGPTLNAPAPGNRPMPMQNAADPLLSKRRTLYLPILRNNLPDMFQVFDFPDPHALSGKRYTTTAATQAVFMMNSPYVKDQAQSWAKRLITESSADDSRVDVAYYQAFGRPPAQPEKHKSLKFIERYSNSLQKIESDPEARSLLAWTGFCQALFQTTEFRFID